jgi:hypothetical protein
MPIYGAVLWTSTAQLQLLGPEELEKALESLSPLT